MARGAGALPRELVRECAKAAGRADIAMARLIRKLTARYRGSEPAAMLTGAAAGGDEQLIREDLRQARLSAKSRMDK